MQDREEREEREVLEEMRRRQKINNEKRAVTAPTPRTQPHGQPRSQRSQPAYVKRRRRHTMRWALVLLCLCIATGMWYITPDAILGKVLSPQLRVVGNAKYLTVTFAQPTDMVGYPAILTFAVAGQQYVWHEVVSDCRSTCSIVTRVPGNVALPDTDVRLIKTVLLIQNERRTYLVGPVDVGAAQYLPLLTTAAKD